ncbi:DUF433 domain-containing protein [Duganella guangzhouensis]|nr:DUF433 domain-containing protein [Duganella guangzhouensis]
MSTDKAMPLSDEELAAFETTRDIHAELQQTLDDLAADRSSVVYSPLIAARKVAGVTQQEFADFIGVSAETLEDWEQRRQQPSKSALMMLAIAMSKPEVVQSGIPCLDRKIIQVDYEIMGGSPVFTGTRVPLSCLFSYLGSGASIDTFLDEYPSVPRESAALVIAMAGQIICGYAQLISSTDNNRQDVI